MPVEVKDSASRWAHSKASSVVSHRFGIESEGAHTEERVVQQEVSRRSYAGAAAVDVVDDDVVVAKADADYTAVVPASRGLRNVA